MPYAITTPNKIIEGSFVSKWVAAHNPVNFYLQRRDYEVLIASKINTTTLRVFVSTPFSGDQPAVGSFVYISAGVWQGVFTVASSFSNGFTVTTSKPGSATYNGFVNLIGTKTNYYFETKVNHIVNNIITPIVTLRFSPDNTGLAKVNISEALKSVITINNEYDYADQNYADTDGSGVYFVQFREVDKLASTSFAPATINQNVEYYFANAAKQLQSTHGSNIGEYVPTLVNVAEANKAKFMTVFEKPVYWEGYPFSLSFVYSRDIVAVQKRVVRKESRKDINGTELSTGSANLDIYQKKFVNHMRVDTGYISTVKEVDVWLEVADEATLYDIPVKGQYVETGYHQLVAEIPYSNL